jgi:hypothetical protein
MRTCYVVAATYREQSVALRSPVYADVRTNIVGKTTNTCALHAPIPFVATACTHDVSAKSIYDKYYHHPLPQRLLLCFLTVLKLQHTRIPTQNRFLRRQTFHIVLTGLGSAPLQVMQGDLNGTM